MCECIFKRAPCQIIALPRGLQETQERREEEHTVHWLLCKHLRHTNTDIHFCRQTRLEAAFVHPCQALIGKRNCCMHQSMNLAVLRLYLFICLRKRVTICCISADIRGLVTQSCEPVKLRLDVCIQLTPANPYHLCLIVSDQMFAEYLSNSTCA